MKHIFYLAITFLSFTVFLSAGFNNLVSAATDEWIFDASFPTCALAVTPPNQPSGSTLNATAVATATLPSIMNTISIGFVTGQIPVGSWATPTSTCSGSGTLTCTRSYNSSSNDQSLSFLAKPENKAGNISACQASYLFPGGPWLKTSGGDVHANQ